MCATALAGNRGRQRQRDSGPSLGLPRGMRGNSTGMQRGLRAHSRHRVGRRTAAVLLAVIASSVFAASALAAAPPPPAASTGSVSSVTASSAVLHGSLDAKAQPTNYVFQYGTTKFYGGQTPLAPGGRAPSTIQVSQAIGGLQADTTYHYRILATSASGATRASTAPSKHPRSRYRSRSSAPPTRCLSGIPSPCKVR